MDQQFADVHARALREFTKTESAQRDERYQCLQDRRFYSIAGAMWEGPLGQQFENKPRFEVNKVHLAVIRIINEYRNNRLSVCFQPKDGVANDKLADTCAGLFRADEQDSGAQEAYDNCFEEGVGGGFGAIRLRCEYEDDEDEENEYQRICIEPIVDADSCVFYNLGATRQDKKDAKRCWVLTGYSFEEYEERYGEDPSTWPKSIHQNEFDWTPGQVVYVAEYYEIEETHVKKITVKDPVGNEETYTKDEFEEKAAELRATGWKKVAERSIKTKRVHKYIMNGARILEDCGYIAGKLIPIVPYYGKRWFVDGTERCMGHVRLAKDATRLKNMQISKLAEVSALSSVEKPIFTPEQMAGHTTMWSEDSVKNYPFVLINTLTDAQGNPMPAGPLGYTKPPMIAPAMAALLQLTETDLQDVLGNQQAAEQLPENISGKAVELIQNRLDMQVFIYVDNFAKTIQRVGEVWLSMAKDVYADAGRKMKSIGPSDEVGSVELLRPMIDKKTKKQYLENDMSQAGFNVSVTVGPSSDSRRAATVRALTGMMALVQDPDTMQVLQSMAMMNMEGEGIQDVRDYFRQILLRKGVVKPTDEEAEQMAKEQAAQGQQIDPQSQYLLSAAQEAEANAADKRANTMLTVAKTEKTQADTTKVLHDMHMDAESATTDRIAAMQPQAPAAPPK